MHTMKRISTAEFVIMKLRGTKVEYTVLPSGNVVTSLGYAIPYIQNFVNDSNEREYNCENVYVYEFDRAEISSFDDKGEISKLTPVMRLVKYGIKFMTSKYIIFDSEYSASIFMMTLPKGADMEFEE